MEGLTAGKRVPSGALENEDGGGAGSVVKNAVPLRIREAIDGGPMLLFFMYKFLAARDALI